MAKFDIWVEGYVAQGGEGQAQLIESDMEGENFRDACIKWAKSKDQKWLADHWGNFDKRRLTLWGCRLFPTEAEARKSFG